MVNVMGRLAVAALLVAPLSQSVRADTLLPDLNVPGATEWKGESQLCSDKQGCAAAGGDSIFVDWVVQYDSTNKWYNYYYQLENTSSETLGEGSVVNGYELNFYAPTPFFYAGWVGGTSPSITDPAGNVPIDPTIPADLDDIHNLSGEGAEVTKGLVSPTVANINELSQTATWYFFSSLPQGYESVTLVARSWSAPGYGLGSLSGHNRPAPWSSEFGDPLPIPGPEPAGLILMGSAMLAATTLLRRSRKKSV